MQLPPTSVLLSWPTPNYVNPPTQGISLVIITIIFMTLISLAVPLRIMYRLRTSRRLEIDDVLILFAYIFSMGLGIVVILANVRYQWNRHLWDVEISMFQNASIVAMVAKAVFTFAATFTRASLICFYFRLIKDTNLRPFRWILWSAQLYNIAICIVFFLLTVFICSPVQAYWVFPMIDGAKCLNEGAVTLVAGVLNCISDLLVTILPVPIVMRLNMPLRQRIGVSILLSLGLIVTFAGVVRTYYIWKTLMGTYDETWDSMPLYICAAVEIDLAVLCACAPTLKTLLLPLIKRMATAISTVAHNRSNQSAPSDMSSAPVVHSDPNSSHSTRGGTDRDKIFFAHVRTGTGTGTGSGTQSSEESGMRKESYHQDVIPMQDLQRPSSRASSQRTMIHYNDGVGTLERNTEETCEGDDVVTELVNPSRRYHRHADVERADRYPDEHVAKAAMAGWI